MDVPSVSQPALRTVEIAPPSARAETWNMLRAAALIVLATWIYIADTAAPAGSGTRALSGTGEAGATAGDGPAAGGATTTAGPGAAAGTVSAETAGRPAGTRDGGGAAEGRDLMPYQRLFRTLDGDDQRLFRELQEGLLEAENARSSTRRWPAPAALAAQGIPPFADAAGRGGRRSYHWQLRQEGPIVNYLGAPADRRDPALLLLVQEPDPQAPLALLAPLAPLALLAPTAGSLPRPPPGAPSQGGQPGAFAQAAPAAPAAPAAQATDEVHHRLADGTLLHVSIWRREMLRARAAGAASPSGWAGDFGSEPGVIAEPYARGWIQVLVGATRQ